MAMILLIRHGLNDLVGTRLAGRMPGVHLNRKGRLQAEQIACRLAELPLRAMYSSPLERAVETAQPAANALGLEIQSHPGLNEMDYGILQGKPTAQLERMEFWKEVQQRPSQARFPEGETFPAAQQRAVAAIEEIQAAWDALDIVACFSHCDIVRLITAHYLQMPLDGFQRLVIDPGSITILHRWEDTERVAGLNFPSQLEPGALLSMLIPGRRK